MSSTQVRTRNTKPQAAARAAEIVREYGPFAGADNIAGVTHDGRRVWAATGSKIDRLRSRERPDRAHARPHRRRWHHLRRHVSLPDRRSAHRQDRSRHRRRRGVDPGARPRQRLGPRLGRGQSVGGAVPRSQDSPDRSRDRRHPAHYRVQPVCHRRDLGRWRVVARHLGRRRERHPPHRSRRAAPCSSGWRCRSGTFVSGLESDGADLFYAGGGPSGKVRAVRRPLRKRASKT